MKEVAGGRMDLTEEELGIYLVRQESDGGKE